MTNEDIARAFSRHDFERVLEHLDEDVEWRMRGNQTLVGRDAVAAACRSSAADLTAVTTSWLRCIAVAGPDAAFVDAIGRYDHARDGVSIVSSCDVYEFRNQRVVRITSYAVELDPASSAAS